MSRFFFIDFIPTNGSFNGLVLSITIMVWLVYLIVELVLTISVKKTFLNFHSDAFSKFLQMLMNVAPPREYTSEG